jgi:septal ring factor EnvC (AmiA/AmiB activator)
MKMVWIAGLAIAASASAFAQSTIYKHVDDSGRVTYSNKPMKGAVVMELDPITTMPSPPAAVLQRAASIAASETKFDAKPQPIAAVVTPVPSTKTTLAAVEPQMQRRRDDDRRKILEEELKQEEETLGSARDSLLQEQQNPMLIAAVRVAQQASDPTPAQLAEMRGNIDKASGRIRGLQATVAEHEKNIEALKKELGALKP